MSRNESLPWKENLLEEYSSKWDWLSLSGNNGVGFTMDQLEKYNEKIFWESKDPGKHTIAENTSLPWSEELIDKYSKKWHWRGLAMNTGINWSESIIEKYREKIDNYFLFRNPSLPWTFDFLLKYEEDCFSAWNSECSTISEVVWNKVFKLILNDELVDEILSNMANPHLLMKANKESKNENDYPDPIKQLAEAILLLQINLYSDLELNKTIETVLNKIKICVVKIANASEKEHVNDYMFFDDYYNQNSTEFNQCLIESMKPIKNAIIECFESEIIDVDSVRDVVKKHNQQMKTYSEFKKAGDHISFDFSYLAEFTAVIGFRALTLGRLLVRMEKMEEFC